MFNRKFGEFGNGNARSRFSRSRNNNKNNNSTQNNNNDSNNKNDNNNNDTQNDNQQQQQQPKPLIVSAALLGGGDGCDILPIEEAQPAVEPPPAVVDGQLPPAVASASAQPPSPEAENRQQSPSPSEQQSKQQGPSQPKQQPVIMPVFQAMQAMHAMQRATQPRLLMGVPPPTGAAATTAAYRQGQRQPNYAMKQMPIPVVQQQQQQQPQSQKQRRQQPQRSSQQQQRSQQRQQQRPRQQQQRQQRQVPQNMRQQQQQQQPQSRAAEEEEEPLEPGNQWAVLSNRVHRYGATVDMLYTGRAYRPPAEIVIQGQPQSQAPEQQPQPRRLYMPGAIPGRSRATVTLPPGVLPTATSMPSLPSLIDAFNFFLAPQPPETRAGPATTVQLIPQAATSHNNNNNCNNCNNNKHYNTNSNNGTGVITMEVIPQQPMRRAPLDGRCLNIPFQSYNTMELSVRENPSSSTIVFDATVSPLRLLSSHQQHRLQGAVMQEDIPVADALLPIVEDLAEEAQQLQLAGLQQPLAPELLPMARMVLTDDRQPEPPAVPMPAPGSVPIHIPMPQPATSRTLPMGAATQPAVRLPVSLQMPFTLPRRQQRLINAGAQPSAPAQSQSRLAPIQVLMPRNRCSRVWSSSPAMGFQQLAPAPRQNRQNRPRFYNVRSLVNNANSNQPPHPRPVQARSRAAGNLNYLHNVPPPLPPLPQLPPGFYRTRPPPPPQMQLAVRQGGYQPKQQQQQLKQQPKQQPKQQLQQHPPQ